MSGHSKWATIKRKKGAADAKRGQLFSKLSRAIIVAAKEGGGDPEGNAALAAAVQKARDNSMPKDNIERAIQRGAGAGDGEAYEGITYEGYGPGGVAFIVKATTDNKSRAAQEIRSTFAHHAGNLASAGAVAFQFLHAGQFLLTRDKTTEDALMEIALEAGADDVIASEQGFEVRCGIHAFDKVSHALEEKGLKPDSAEIAYIPTNAVPVTDVAVARTLLKLHDALEEMDDVQAVYSNEEMDDAVVAAAQA